MQRDESPIPPNKLTSKMTQREPSSRRRAYLRRGLWIAAAIAIPLVIALLLELLPTERDREWERQRAVAKLIHARGGEVYETIWSESDPSIMDKIFDWMAIRLGPFGFSRNRGRVERGILAVNLSRVGIDDHGLKELATLRDLRELMIGSPDGSELPQFSDVGFAHLGELKELVSLNVTQSAKYGAAGISDEAVAHLSGLTKLRELTLQNTSITGMGLAFVSKLTNLEALHIHGSSITDDGLVHLKSLTELRKLSLTNASVNGDGLVYLQNLSELDSLDLSGSDINDKGLAAARSAKLGHIADVDLSRTHITDAGLAHLRALGLTADLNETPITGAGLRSFVGWQQPYRLSLANSEVSDEGLAAAQLDQLSQVGTLDLSGTNVTDVGLVHVAKLPKLWRLNLANTNIADAGLVHVAKLPELSHLHLENTKVSDAGLLHIDCHPKLSCVYLEGTLTTRVARDNLRRQLSNRDWCP